MNKSETLRQVFEQQAIPLSLDVVMDFTGFQDRNFCSTVIGQMTKRGQLERIESDDKVRRWQWVANEQPAPPRAKQKAPTTPKRLKPPAPVKSTGLAVSVDLHTNEVCIQHGEGSIVLDIAALAELATHLQRAQAALEA